MSELYETIETHARAFLTLSIFAIGSVLKSECIYEIINYPKYHQKS